MSKGQNFESTITHYKLTPHQKEISSTILDEKSKLIFIDGVAGTGKTYLATYTALRLLSRPDQKFKDLLYIRNNIECASKTFGILPGDLTEKFQPWSMPLDDKLDELLPKGVSSTMKFNKEVKSIPINFLRGASFKNKVLIVDEAQNIHLKEFITVLTRIGEDCKVIVIGDSMQTDIKEKESGFGPLMDLFSDPESEDQGIYTFKLDENDIVRSELLRFIIKRITTL